MADDNLNTISLNNSIATLSSYQAAYKNDFEVTVDNNDLNDHARLHAISLQFPGAKLTLERHNVTKLFMLSKYQRADEVTITWRETRDFLVRKFHQDWMKKFYDEDSDRFTSYGTADEAREALTRTFTVKLPNGHSIVLRNAMPTAIPDADFSWSDSALIQYALRYKVTSWSWE